MADILSFRGGINLRVPAYALSANQCVSLRNLRVEDEIVESIPGTKKYHSNSLGSDPVTAIIPHYGDDGTTSEVLCASGSTLYKKNQGANTFSALKTGLTPNRIISAASRHGFTYIASDEDDWMRYDGGEKTYKIGGGSTRPSGYQIVLYMKETDRMFGLRHKSIKGQIGWSEISDPENWDAANVDKVKLQEGEIVENGAFLYGKLIVFNTYSIWIYYVSGNPENWKFEPAPTTVGIRGYKTLKQVGRELWFLGDSPRSGIGVYAFNGSTSRLLTDDVTPLLERINPNKIDECAAEYYDGIYRLTFPLDAATSNSHTIELDSYNIKEDGTPAIYGVHDINFNSSAVLNTRDYGGELLLGDFSDGFVYKEGGISFKAGDSGTDGGLLAHRFLSPVYNDGSFNVMKRYNDIGIYFRPKGYYQAKIRAYFAYGVNELDHRFTSDATVHSLSGDFNVFEDRAGGLPDLAEYKRYLPLESRGVSIQIEILNDTINKLAFQGIRYTKNDLYETKEAQYYSA